MLIIKKEFRDRDCGLAMTKKGLDYIGSRNAGLDGVVEMQAAYAKNRFKYLHRNLRFHGVGEKMKKFQPKEYFFNLPAFGTGISL